MGQDSGGLSHCAWLLAVTREALARSNLLPVIRKFGRAPCGRAWNTQRIGDALDELPESVVVESNGAYKVAPELRRVLLDHLEAEDRLTPIAAVVRRRLPLIDERGSYLDWDRLEREVDLARRAADGRRLVELSEFAWELAPVWSICFDLSFRHEYDPLRSQSHTFSICTLHAASRV